MNSALISVLNEDSVRKIESINAQCSLLLDTMHRFKYFTLHGSEHVNNMFKILDIFLECGLELNEREAFLLACAICVHDVGMVTPLSDLDTVEVLGGYPQPPDPGRVNEYIRKMHHELIDDYVKKHFDFLVSIGLTIGECNIIKDIAKCHRKENLKEKTGYVARLGALLRVIDELDVYPSRAPISVLMRDYHDMDATSCWHWYKHSICEEWMVGHNVFYEKNKINMIRFRVVVHPSSENSIQYWLNNITKPIRRELIDEGAAGIITENYGLKVVVEKSQDLSAAFEGAEQNHEIEQKALSAGKKVILFVDDEVRKMQDLFIDLMESYHIMFSPNAKDALQKIEVTNIDLAIIDLQIGSGFEWTSNETEDYKMTGLKLVKEIQKKYPDTKAGVLTGSKYDLSEVKKNEGLVFILRKPIDPDKFTEEVSNVLK